MTLWLVAGLVVAFFLGFAFGRRRPGLKVVWSEPIVPIPSPDVEILLQQGQKIEAIKLYRQLHGTDLKDSKDAVDALARQLSSGQ